VSDTPGKPTAVVAHTAMGILFRAAETVPIRFRSVYECLARRGIYCTVYAALCSTYVTVPTGSLITVQGSRNIPIARHDTKNAAVVK
jgi:hypothetical protein